MKARPAPNRPSVREALLQSEERFRSLVEFLPMGVVAICDQKIVYANPAALSLYGAKQPADLLGLPVLAVVPPDRRAALAADLKKQLIAKTPAILHEGAILRLNGRRLEVLVGGTPFIFNGRPATLHVFSDITERKRAAEKIRQMAAELRATNRSLLKEMDRRRTLEQQILEISEREQRRLGSDVHDGLGQHLVGIRFLAATLRQQLAGGGGTALQLAEQIARESGHAIHHARQIARGLHPIQPDSQGLMVALGDLAANVADLFKVPCRFECSQVVLIEDDHAATHLFRIVQEAVTNAVRHARAHQIWIRLRHSDGCIHLSVEDDGRGLPRGARRSHGLGLATMQYRASLLGANYTIGARRTGGTRLALVWQPPQPKTAAEAPRRRQHQPRHGA